MNIEDVTVSQRSFEQHLAYLKDLCQDVVLKNDCTLEAVQSTFKPGAFYNEHGDCLEVYWTDHEHLSEWLSSTISIHRSLVDGTIVGCTVHGVSKLV